MKGINMKKIAAFAAGIAMLGAAVAVADVVYGSTPLVNQNGQPVVKVVVGEKAMASDGVAAGNIAAAIANKAFKSSTLTASVSGEATCSSGGAAGGAGSCAISNEKVTLEVTVPGSQAGVAKVTTLINDFVDRTTQNRNRTAPEDVYNASLSEISDTVSPYKNATGYLTTGKYEQLAKIGTDFTPFADYAVADPKASFKTTESQTAWISGKNKFDSSRDEVVAWLDVVTYAIKFTGDEYGIPYCIQSNNSDYSYCKGDSSSSDATKNHRIPVKFLGSQWVISDMTIPTYTTMPDSASAYAGGTIKIAKESSYGIINVGDKLDAGEVQIKLSDISVATGSENKHPAIVDILDSTGKVIAQQQINKGDTYNYVTDTGKSVRIHVYETSPGFTLNAKWAEMAIYSDELELRDNVKVDSTTNKDWKPIIFWKNKDPSPASVQQNTTDSLRGFLLFTEPSAIRLDPFKKGESLNIIGSPSPFTLTFDGIDLTSDDYSSLQMRIVSYDSIATSATGTSCATTATLNSTKMVQVSSGTANAFTIGSESADTMLLSLQNQSVAAQGVAIYYKPTGTSETCYHYSTLALGTPANTSTSNLYTITSTKDVKFSPAGEFGTTTAGGVLRYSIQTQNDTVVSALAANISIYEDSGRAYGVSNAAGSWQIPVINSSNSYVFKTSSSSSNVVNYTGPITTDIGLNYGTIAAEAPYISDRGSVFKDLATDAVLFNIAKKVGKTTLTLASSGTASTAGATEITLAEGEEQTVSGVKIKAKSITESVGACTSSVTAGAPACTVDQTGVKAKIVSGGEYKDSVEVIEPYSVGKLVILDNAASASDAVITVGGPAVNTVTADALAGSAVDFNTDRVVVKEVGKKIVVAGLTADDTLSAADKFIAGIKKQ